jgi:hypothetical protein
MDRRGDWPSCLKLKLLRNTIGLDVAGVTDDPRTSFAGSGLPKGSAITVS